MLKRNFPFFIFAFFAPLLSLAQVEFSTLRHDFENLESSSPRFVDITIKNKGNGSISIFSVRNPKEIDYLISQKRIQADSSSIIRFQVNPKKKGPFKYTVEVFTSNQNDAHKIVLQGNLLEIPTDRAYEFASCPSFGEQAPQTTLRNFTLLVHTIDAESKENLSESTVQLIQNGEMLWQKQSNKDGIVKTPAELGLSYFYAEHKGYFPAELGTYINFKRNEVTLELLRDSSVQQEQLQDATAQLEEKTLTTEAEIIPSDNSPSPKIEEERKEEIEEDKNQETPSLNHPELSSLDPNNFDEQHFNTLNVVFILDISTSMKQADKIELMKYALMQLTEMLRPQDRFGMLSYASTVEIQIKGATGDEKELIKEKVKGLNAGGFTSGGTGIKMGFQIAESSKVIGGSNMVIVITDGAFNKGAKDYKKHIKKYRKKGFKLSIVGIKNNPKDEEEMRSIAELGGGQYVPIMKLSDAQNNLKQEIRRATFKHSDK